LSRLSEIAETLVYQEKAGLQSPEAVEKERLPRLEE
jgi:hypothetical protein